MRYGEGKWSRKPSTQMLDERHLLDKQAGRRPLWRRCSDVVDPLASGSGKWRALSGGFKTRCNYTPPQTTVVAPEPGAQQGCYIYYSLFLKIICAPATDFAHSRPITLRRLGHSDEVVPKMMKKKLFSRNLLLHPCQKRAKSVHCCKCAKNCLSVLRERKKDTFLKYTTFQYVQYIRLGAIVTFWISPLLH